VLAGFDEVKNKGLDIGGTAGEPVLAAADGRVVYVGAGLRGYGNLIILKHNNTYLTAYAHNQTLLIKEDQSVRKGQKIAEMGSTDSDRVKLHFEVRRQGKPVDPVKYLPTPVTRYPTVKKQAVTGDGPLIGTPRTRWPLKIWKIRLLRM
jgi:lipoprotein NlpD